MYISNFKYKKPENIKEILDMLNEYDNPVLLAGGTDLLVEIKKGIRRIDTIVSISRINELKKIEIDETKISIGAGLTHSEVNKSELIIKYLPTLAYAVSQVGSHQIRNTGTIGGNLCTGASCADTAPILIAYNANVELVSNDGIRNVPLSDFFLSHHHTVIKKNELMTKIIIERNMTENYKNGKLLSGAFEKFGLRQASSISVASSAVVISIMDGISDYVSIVTGACSPIPMKSKPASDLLFGISIDELINNHVIIERSAELASLDTMPIDDLRGSADYRRNLVKVLTQRALNNAMGKIENKFG